ncbi:hypothetical protein H4R20_007337 [Coemansia guatemalensis]|uniref:Uncharacterized protein n=1 Tax=Coemansia guatemalensis TaxID=2761395 RepID=A0A9W8LPC1_9FUNG|nr:hypothetical protein H4R20_007337 [Coemansia guatemalensis]
MSSSSFSTMLCCRCDSMWRLALREINERGAAEGPGAACGASACGLPLLAVVTESDGLPAAPSVAVDECGEPRGAAAGRGECCGAGAFIGPSAESPAGLSAGSPAGSPAGPSA